MCKKQLVVVVTPSSVDVYERTEHDDGRVERKPVPAKVVRMNPLIWRLVIVITTAVVSAVMARLGQ